MKKQLHASQELTHRLACAMEKVMQGADPGKPSAESKKDLPAKEASLDYKEMEVAAMSLLQAPGKDFTDKEKSYFVLLAWYCLRKQEESRPVQEEHQAA